LQLNDKGETLQLFKKGRKMPYDPRPTTEGGNRGIDINFSRKAPPGQFRVIGVDTFDGGDWVDADLPTLDQAQRHIKDRTRGKQMMMMYVYDEHGKCVGKAGSF
jgi:hypothetical protein